MHINTTTNSKNEENFSVLESLLLSVLSNKVFYIRFCFKFDSFNENVFSNFCFNNVSFSNLLFTILKTLCQKNIPLYYIL